MRYATSPAYGVHIWLQSHDGRTAYLDPVYSKKHRDITCFMIVIDARMFRRTYCSRVFNNYKRTSSCHPQPFPEIVGGRHNWHAGARSCNSPITVNPKANPDLPRCLRSSRTTPFLKLKKRCVQNKKKDNVIWVQCTISRSYEQKHLGTESHKAPSDYLRWFFCGNRYGLPQHIFGQNCSLFKPRFPLFQILMVKSFIIYSPYTVHTIV